MENQPSEQLTLANANLHKIEKDMALSHFIDRHESWLGYAAACLYLGVGLSFVGFVSMLFNLPDSYVGPFLFIVLIPALFVLIWGLFKSADYKLNIRKRYMHGVDMYFESMGGAVYYSDILKRDKGSLPSLLLKSMQVKGMPDVSIHKAFSDYVNDILMRLHPANPHTAPLPLTIAWYYVGEHLLVFVEIEAMAEAIDGRLIRDWVVLSPLSFTRANLYVDVTDNGTNRYLSRDAAVQSLELGGAGCKVYTAKGGDSDAYQIFDPVFTEWLQTNHLPYDFEILNDQLVIRRSSPQKGFSRSASQGHDTFYYSEVMQGIYNQAEALLWQLEDRRRTSMRHDLRRLPDPWRNHLEYSKSHEWLAKFRRETQFMAFATFLLFVIVLGLPFLGLIVGSIFADY